MVNFIRPKSGFTLLEGLSLSAGQIVPYFSQQTTSYTYTVANSVTSTKVTVTRGSITGRFGSNDHHQRKTGAFEGNGIRSHSAQVGAESIEVIVTAPNEATRTYTITVRSGPSSPNASYPAW